MRSTVIAAMTAAAITKARRAAPPEGAVMSEAVVTAALFANLAGGVNAEVSAVPGRDVVASPHVIGQAVRARNSTLRWLFSPMN